MELAPNADDIWFWAMTVLNGMKIIIPPAAMNDLIYVDLNAQLGNETLSSKNIGGGQNDIQLRRVFERYPKLLNTLIRDDAESKPYISVIVTLMNPGDLGDIFWQTFPDFEFIIINRGARAETSILPTNFQVINYPDGSLQEALKLGLRRAQGDYVLFKEPNSIFVRTALEVIAQIANNSSADVIHFNGHIQFEDKKIILEDAPELVNEQPQFLTESKQLRAELWLQSKLSRRFGTKIFRREFLNRLEINFNDFSEVMFRALIAAEKYLLVSRAFYLCKEYHGQ